MELGCCTFPQAIFALLIILIILEQISYLKKKQSLPGPTLVLPFLGNALSMAFNPTKFWERQSAYARSTPLGLSANYLAGRFVVYIRSPDISHRVFTNVRPDAFCFIGHPFGRKLFGEHNIIYMFGKPHKEFRRRMSVNFTPRALHTYAIIQQRIMLRHIAAWCGTGRDRPVTLRIPSREMNLETSQTVFVGPYLDGEARKRFNADYIRFNVGLMRLPFDLPGFAFREARLAVERLLGTLTSCVEQSERRMRAGGEPACLIDFWMQETLREEAEKGGEGFEFSCREIADHLFNFMFAVQDASTAVLLWAVVYLDTHSHVLARVREEVAAVWDPRSGGEITGEQMRGLKYTNAVAREVVRIRAPSTLVTHVAEEDFRLTEDYVVSKGTIVFPSVYDACLQGFTEPERFDPDRFMEERQEDRVHRRNYLAFGAGAHQCIGQSYAINSLVLFIAMFASLVDFRRERTDGCDEVVYVPSIVPKDECRVFLWPRVGGFPLAKKTK